MKNGPYTLVIAPSNYPGKKYRNRYVYEHHLVWWKLTGSLVKDGEVIHHKNENHRDNRFNNLELKTVAKHTGDHSKKPWIQTSCGWCGKKLELQPRTYRWRLKNSKSGKLFCSRRCGSKKYGSHQKRLLHNDERILRIKLLKGQGLSDYKISEQTGISRSTVQRLRKNFIEV